MEVKGTIKLIKEAHQVTDSFIKREFVVTTDEMYPQDIPMQATQDKVTMLDAYNVGDPVVCSINLRGKAWKKDEQSEERYFLSADCWRIEKGEGMEALPADMQEEDDLPF